MTEAQRRERRSQARRHHEKHDYTRPDPCCHACGSPITIGEDVIIYHHACGMLLSALRAPLDRLIEKWRLEGADALDMEYGAGLEKCADDLEAVRAPRRLPAGPASTPPKETED